MEEKMIDSVKEQHNRMIEMERLYFLDNRHKPDHPQHGVFTNLSRKKTC